MKTVAPFRNGIIFAIAVGFAESKCASGVVIAAHSGDQAIYLDCRETFLLSGVPDFSAYLSTSALSPRNPAC